MAADELGQRLTDPMRAGAAARPILWIFVLVLLAVVGAWIVLALYLMAAQALDIRWPLGQSSIAEVLYLPFFYDPDEALGKDVAFLPLLLYVPFKLVQASRYSLRCLQGISGE